MSLAQSSDSSPTLWAVRAGARTDAGRVREGNQDALIVRPPHFAVADGLGGRAAGNVASATVAETIVERLDDGPIADPEELRLMLIEANARLRRAGRDNPRLAGMSSTCTLAMVTDELHIAHVGDTRVYRLRAGQLEQLTADHTVVAELMRAGRLTAEQARVDHARNVILRALGADDDLLVDLTRHDLRDGDRLLICSDGLTGMIADARVRDALVALADPQAAADALVDAANRAGGEDNVTVIVVDIRARQPG